MRPRYTNYLRVPIQSLCVQKATQTIRRPIATNPAHPNQNENSRQSANIMFDGNKAKITLLIQ